MTQNAPEQPQRTWGPPVDDAPPKGPRGIRKYFTGQWPLVYFSILFFVLINIPMCSERQEPPKLVDGPFYERSGQIQYQISMRKLKNGQYERHGLTRFFYRNGKTRYAIPFFQGKLHGQAKHWNPAGTLIRQAQFRNGTLIKDTYLDAKGQPLDPPAHPKPWPLVPHP